MAALDHLACLENLECHFTWRLDCSQSTHENLHQDLKDRLNTGCSWMMQLCNLLGYVLQIQGSSDEALAYLREAERMIREQRNEEQNCLLLVNQADLAWVHYLRGELAESQVYAQTAAQLQRALPAPPECDLHPEVAGVKGWSLMKFERRHKQQAIECFKMALRGNPQEQHFHKGLALAMEKGYSEQELNPDLKREVIEKLQAAREMDENDVCVEALYLINALPKAEEGKGAPPEVHTLTDKLVASGRLDGLNNVLYLLMYHFKEYDKAKDVAKKMLGRFPRSTRAKKNLAACLKRKVFSLPEETKERTDLAKRAIAIYEEVNTEHSVNGNISLAQMHSALNNIDAADQIYQSLLEKGHLTDAERQLLYTRYGQYLHHIKQKLSESADMYMRAVKIPVTSEHRDKCFQYLMSYITKTDHSKVGNIHAADHIYQSLLEKGHLTDAEKQQLYLRYGQYLYYVKQMPSESTGMYMRAVQIPGASEHRDQCFQLLMANMKNANMNPTVGNNDAADHIYQSLLEQGQLTDAEKQLLYLQYGQYLYHIKQMPSESVNMYIKAVKIPVTSANRDKCFQLLMSNIKNANMNPTVGNNDAADHIYQSLLESGHLTDAEKQQLYFQYGQYLFHVKKMPTVSADMYMKAVKIPVTSANRGQCFKFLMSYLTKENHSKVGNNDATDNIYQSLLEKGHLTDVEKQQLYLRYGQYLYHVKQMPTEAKKMYQKAVDIPVASEYKVKCIKYLK